jgi:hypothetical protein
VLKIRDVEFEITLKEVRPTSDDVVRVWTSESWTYWADLECPSGEIKENSPMHERYVSWYKLLWSGGRWQIKDWEIDTSTNDCPWRCE